MGALWIFFKGPNPLHLHSAHSVCAISGSRVRYESASPAVTYTCYKGLRSTRPPPPPRHGGRRRGGRGEGGRGPASPRARLLLCRRALASQKAVVLVTPPAPTVSGQRNVQATRRPPVGFALDWDMQGPGKGFLLPAASLATVTHPCIWLVLWVRSAGG